MDATTILATICCAAVFGGWLLLPHSGPKAIRPVSEEREPARLSA
jgi:hypothetical protein